MKIADNGFGVLEVVRTSFDVGVGPKNTEMRRSVQFANRFETTSAPKFRTTSILIEIRVEGNSTFRQIKILTSKNTKNTEHIVH